MSQLEMAQKILSEREQQSKPSNVAIAAKILAEREAQAQQPPEEAPEGGMMDAIEEPIFSIGSNILGAAGAGLAGIAALPFKGVEGSAELVTNIQDTVAEETAPKTKMGQKGLETVGDIIDTGIDIARMPIAGLVGLGELLKGKTGDEATAALKDFQDRGFQSLGDRALESTESPGIATAVSMIPELVGAAIPVTKAAKTKAADNKEIATAIESGATDKKLAPYIVTGSGKAIKDPLYKPLVRKGMEEGALSAVKASTNVDKAKMMKMVDIRQKGLENSLYGMKNRPSDVAGDSLAQRVRHIKTVNNTAGQRLNIEAKKLKGQSVDFSQPIENFKNNLNEIGIKLDDNLNPIFKGSDIEGIASLENAVKTIVKRLASGERGHVPDAYDLHRMKRFIDENVTYGKSSGGLTGKTEGVLKSLRHDIDAALDGTFPSYDKVNRIYADTVEAIDSLQSVAGSKMDLYGPNADKAIGTLLRRLMSNAQSRINLADSVDQLDAIAKKYGGEFNDDVAVQILFANQLDKMFGAAADTSLQGDVAKAVTKGIDNAMGSKSMLNKAADVAKTGIDKALNQSDEQALKTLREMLSRRPDPYL